MQKADNFWTLSRVVTDHYPLASLEILPEPTQVTVRVSRDGKNPLSYCGTAHRDEKTKDGYWKAVEDASAQIIAQIGEEDPRVPLSDYLPANEGYIVRNEQPAAQGA